MKKSFGKLRIVVAGYIIRGPLGGLVWHHFQYVIGLHRMGHEVLFFEDSDDYPSCYDPVSDRIADDPSYGIAFTRDMFSRFGLDDRWTFHDALSGYWHGLGRQEAKEFMETADLLLNLSGINPLRDFLMNIPRRVFVDTDPVFTQIRHLEDAAALDHAKKHTHFLSFGENFGMPDCTMPDDNLPWKPTRQPVVQELWPLLPGPKSGKWTTVMQWNSYANKSYRGLFYGMKSDSFPPYMNLPSRISTDFEIALGGKEAPFHELAAAGWHVVNSISVTKTPAAFQFYLRQSKGEWSVAKQGYASTQCGWFSERTSAYLASGRPAIVQDTGFTKNISTGRGLFCFKTPDEVLTAMDSVNSDYDGHCRASTEIIDAYFNYVSVLDTLLENSFA